MVQPSNRRLATEQFVTDAGASKVNSSTYTAGLAGKQDVATLGATVAADATVRATFGTRSALPWPSGLVAFWDFAETAPPFVAKVGRGPLPLANGTSATVTTVADGPFGNAAVFDGTTDYLTLPAASIGPLDLAQIGDTVTVLAWVRRDDTDQGCIAGVWQEDSAAARRQYALFLDLSTYGGDEQVCGHVSAAGGPTPGYPFSRDYSASARKINPARGDYRMVAFTYDGTQVISYLDGLADARPTFTDSLAATYAKNPYLYGDGLNRATAAADFTVGANHLTGGMSNFFGGRIGGLAVFDRALTAAEIMRLHVATRGTDPLAWFDNYTPTAGSFAPSELGWRSARGTGGTDTSDSTAANNFMITTVSGNTFMFRSASGDATNTTTNGIGYYPTVAGLRLSQVKQATFRLHNSLAADYVRLLIRVDSTWYVTATTYSVTGDGRAGGDWSTAETKTITLDRSAGIWQALTFTPGSALTLGTVMATAIPNGDLTAVGFFAPSIAGTVRVDDLKLIA